MTKVEVISLCRNINSRVDEVEKYLKWIRNDVHRFYYYFENRAEDINDIYESLYADNLDLRGISSMLFELMDKIVDATYEVD